MKISYGYVVEPKDGVRDPLVDLADEAVSQFSRCSQPGVWLVDTLPICTSFFYLSLILPSIFILEYVHARKGCVTRFSVKHSDLNIVRYLPDWLPGTGFKKTAKAWKEKLNEVVERPYAFVKHQMVKTFFFTFRLSITHEVGEVLIIYC